MKQENKKEQASKGFGIASLVVGILGLVMFLMPYIAIFLSIMAVVFSAIQSKKLKTGLATAGLVTGIIGIVFNSLILIFMMIFIGFAATL